MSSEVLKNGHGPTITLSEVSESLADLDSLDTPRCTDDERFFADDPPVVEIGRDLDTLTYSGSTINDLEVQLTHSKEAYQRALIESRRTVEGLRRKLNSHIRKSEPFIDIWRRARQIQEESNKAAMRYDKANSQHAASKEMIRMAESQLGSRRTSAEVDPSSPSPLDLAWQEMLNHATLKVVETERERRASELEHRAVLEKVRQVMDSYRATEKRLRTHIVKSRPYYEERYRANQRLGQLRQHMLELERKIDESKQTYTNTLKKLELLNTEIHHRRALSQTIPRGRPGEDPRLSSSTGCSPHLRHRDMSDTESLDSVQVPQGFTGSIGSLPSVGISPVSSPTPPLSETPHERSETPNTHSTDGEDPVITKQSKLVTSSPEKLCASQLVSQCLAAAVQHVEHNS